MKSYKYILLLVVTMFALGCTEVNDMAVGDWSCLQEMYILDDEDDPITFYMSMHLVLSDTKQYLLEVDYIGTAQHEETEHFESYTNSGTWSRATHRLTLDNFGTITIKYFNSDTMVLTYPWPFQGREASELELPYDERAKARMLPVAFTLNKR